MNQTEKGSDRPGTVLNWVAVLIALVLPTVVTLAYFVFAGDSNAGVQQTVYVIAKLVQFAFPVFWVAAIQKRSLQFKLSSFRGVPLGILFGMAVSCMAMVLYYSWVSSAEFFQLGRVAIEQKIAGIGIDVAWKFVAMGIFYSLIHSLLEEYYWRWFVFDQCKGLCSLSLSILISSIGFMAHHVIVIGSYFGFLTVTTWVASLLVAVGGAFWAWLYHQKASLLGPWLSHLLVDAAIFIVGFDIAQKFY